MMSSCMVHNDCNVDGGDRLVNEGKHKNITHLKFKRSCCFSLRSVNKVVELVKTYDGFNMRGRYAVFVLEGSRPVHIFGVVLPLLLHSMTLACSCQKKMYITGSVHLFADIYRIADDPVGEKIALLLKGK